MRQHILPLTAFEHYMWTDDRPSHPMTFWVRLTLLGQTDRERLVAAVHAAVERHPLLRSTVHGRGGAKLKELSWRSAAGASVHIHLAAHGVPLAYPGGGDAGIDLSEEIGIRLFVRQGQVEAQWSLQIHHAVADGIGATKFLDDVLAYYAASGETRLTSLLRPHDSALLTRRGHFHLTTGMRWRRLLFDLREGVRFFSRFAEPAVAGRRQAQAFQAEIYPASLVRDLTQPQLASLKKAAKMQACTVNDLLVRDLFLTLDAWHRRHGKRRRLRLCIPINLRHHAKDQAMPAANIIGMGFLHRQGRQLDDAAGLLQGVTRETTRLKAEMVGFSLIFFMEFFGRVRSGMQWLLKPRFPWACFATAVLSNLGDVLSHSQLPRGPDGQVQAAGLSLRRIELLPPVRPQTALAFGVVTYAGRLALTLHYDHTAIEGDEAKALIVDYAAHLTGYHVEDAAGKASLAGTC